MQEVADAVVRRWPVDRPFPAHALTQAITIDVILRTVFGLEDGSEMRELRDLLKETLDRAADPKFLALPVHLDLGPWTPWAHVAALHRKVHERLQREIVRARADPRPREDVLSLLVRARHEDGAPMADEEIRDELMTLLIAGHETTATAVAWALHRLSMHPEVQARAHAEVDRVLGDRADPERFRELTYVDAIAKETMRLRPVVPGVGRRLMQPARIGGIDLPAGVFAGVSVYLAHRRPETYPEPERFDPERFLSRRFSPYEYLPFGGGIRRCIGMAFAFEELRVILGTVLRRLQLEPVPGHTTKITRRGITLVPSDGALMIARPRARHRDVAAPPATAE
jgi:cytochrome P450